MTKMLVNFDDISNSDMFACDIAGFPYNMLQQLPINAVLSNKQSDNAFLLSITRDEYIHNFLKNIVSQQDVLKVYDYIKLEIPFDVLNDDFKHIEKLAREKRLVVQILNCKKIPDLLTLLPSLASHGVYGVMLAPDNNLDILSEHFSIVDMGVFIEHAHKNGLSAWLSGGIEAPDIPRLLPFCPDVLCFDAAQFLINGACDKQQSDLIRSLIPFEKENIPDSNGIGLGTDRILVKNFVLPMAIGAYNHERNRLQKVRFSVKVDVLRLSVNPEDMRHIFSYDLIIDGIRRLALLGHVDLVETLAERIAAFILSYQRVQRVIVRVEKLELEPEAVGIEIERVKKLH